MRSWVIVMLLLVAATAHADSDTAAMEDYFDGEIAGGWVLTGMGAAGLTAGGILIADGSDRAQGASYVAFGIGGAHLIAGVYINIASRVRKRVYRVAIDRAPDVWRVAETHRMRGVSKTFTILKIAEVTLIAGGATMAALGNAKDRPQLEGAGYALAVEAAATLVFDIIAARRAHRYRARLADLGVTADASGQPVLIIGSTLTF